MRIKDTSVSLGLTKKELSMLNAAAEVNSFTKSLTTDYTELRTLTELLLQNTDIIKLFIKYINLWLKDSTFPYLLLLTDPRGVLLAVEGDTDNLYLSETLGLKAGVNLGKKNIGSHSISGAIEYKRSVYLPKQDNYLDILKQWNEISCIIKGVAGEIKGYITLMTTSTLTVNFLHFVAKQISVTITHDLKLQSLSEIPLEERINETLLEYNLTNRERQITKYWILDYDYKRISEILSISENTVRVFISKINQKINVKSKASMVLKVLLADNLPLNHNYARASEGYRE
ncbi:LuxR C-terminal-related transcriptional regulator [Paenibacillus sp. PL2-23]|uniref:helix-turn-helix transcriptional regulator n=1 Tax=Paenibacillus sp. PL2-23 TaxID=2100729 RepID=UPI0030F519AE